MSTPSVPEEGSWTVLDPDLVAGFFGVPHDLAYSKDNRFYGKKSRYYTTDGSHPIVMLIGSSIDPHWLKLQIHTTISVFDDVYNPLEATFGKSLSLDKIAIRYLIGVMQTEKERVAALPDTGSPAFRELSEEEINNFAIRTDWLPQSKFNVFILNESPNELESSSPLLILIRERVGDKQAGALRVATFPMHNLQVRTFSVLKESKSYMYLSKRAMEEFAIILERYLRAF